MNESVSSMHVEPADSGPPYRPAQSSAPFEPAGAAAEVPADGKVIVIGWQVLLVPLVILAVVGGYWVGRQLQPAPAATVTGVDVPADGMPLVAADAGGGAPIVITLEPSQLQGLGTGFGNEAVPLPPPNHPLLGLPAPDFTMTRLADGEAVTIADLKGKTVMINFWATWCPPCRLEMPWLENVYLKYKDQNFELLAVDAGERVPPSMVPDLVKQFVDRMGLTMPVLLGDNTYDVQRDYAVYGLPSTFIIDPDGRVVDYHNGMYPNEATLDARVQAAFEGGDGSS